MIPFFEILRDIIFYGGAIFFILGIGSYTYLYPIYYFFFMKKLDKHYKNTEASAHPLFPKSSFIRMAIYSGSIIAHKRAMKKSLSNQFFGDDYPRNLCSKFQIFLAYYSIFTALMAIFMGVMICFFDFVIAPYAEIATVFGAN